MKFELRQRLLGTTLLVGASLLANPAMAQEAGQDTGGTNVSNPTGPAEAQPTPATSAEGEPVEEAQDIVVTGSRIPQPNLESTAPVTVVSNQDIKLQGTTKVEDLLNSLPSVFASQASTLSNGATGTATVDLRGLGAVRTLVLVNGRRLGPGSPSAVGPADINTIPASIVRRIEVLTGGASSTYGADAVAGVVNFIMDTNFRGIRFDGQYSFFQHGNDDITLNGGENSRTLSRILNDQIALGRAGYAYPTGNTIDGGTFDGTVSFGVGFDDNRGNAVAYFGYRKAREVTQDRRIYSACTIQNNGSGTPQCGGSATSAEGNVILFDDGTSTFFTFGPNRTLNAGLTRFNFAPTNYFQRPDERYTAGVFANYEISDVVKPYLEFMFMDDRTVAQIAPSGNFGNTLTVNCDNPLISEQQRAIICDDENLITSFIGTYPLTQNFAGAPQDPINFLNPVPGAANATYNQAFFQLLRRNVEGGPRRNDLQHTNFRGVLGTRGDLSKAFSYDAFYQYNRVNYQQSYFNEFSAARLRNALDVVDDPRVANTAASPFQAVCRSVLTGADANCVPYDVFSGAPVSAAAINYLSATGFQRGQTSEQVANVNVTGLLGEYGLQSPFAEDGFGVNVGAEYRKVSLELNTDQAFQTGDLTGQGAPTLPVSGDIQVKEFFAEAQLPLVQNNFVHELSINAGYRRSAYETSRGNEFDTNTYKVGVEFAPVRDVRLRGAYNRAVRAPNVAELFSTQFVGLSGSTDPCAGRVITATDFGCIAQGLAVGSSTPENPAGQYNALLGGNPNLQPEKATTKTFGVVLQPRFLPRFALTVDYFDISVNGAIQGFGADPILADCNTSTATMVRPSCSLVNRDAGGSIWLTSGGFVRNLPTNIGGLQTRGVEVNSSYSHRLGGLGNLSASLIGTYLREYEIDNGLTPVYDCSGLFGSTCGQPAPKWRHKARVTLQTPAGIGLSLQWRHFGRVTADSLESNASLSGPFTFDPGREIKAQNYFDFASTFSIGSSYNLRLGVNNLLDRAPPLVTSGNASRAGSNLCPSGPCNGNTYPAVYDALGRYFYAGITLDF
jgi:outer membrane receptor protein involved in Fe transport